MLKEIYNNPYRILGVYSNSQKKEQVANKGRMQAFLRVKKPVHFPLDLEGILPELRRTQELVDYADSELALSSGQIKHAQFWFINITPVDSIAFNHLIAGDLNSAIKIWKKAENMSSFQNLFVCYLIKGNYKNAVIDCAVPLYNKYADNLVSTIDYKAYFKPYDLISFIIDVFAEEKIDITYIGKNTNDPVWKEVIGSKAVDPIISQLESLVSETKESKNKGEKARLTAGKMLMKKSKPLLDNLKQMLSECDLHLQIIADKIAQEVLQCSIDYYNASSELDSPAKALPLCEYAKTVALGKIAQQRTSENYVVIKKAFDAMPPLNVLEESKLIYDNLNWFKKQSPTSLNSIMLLEKVRNPLINIKEKLKYERHFYIEISTIIANAALGNVIHEVNEAQKEDRPDQHRDWLFIPPYLCDEKDRKRRRIERIKKALHDAWQAIKYIDLLDVTKEFEKNNYSPNRNTLSSIIEGVQGFGTHSAYFPLSGCAYGIYVDSKYFWCDSEHYKSCHSIHDYEAYLQRFPSGVHVKEANKRIVDITDNNRYAACESLKDYQAYLQQFPSGLHKAEAIIKIEKIHRRRKVIITIFVFIAIIILLFLFVNSANAKVLNRNIESAERYSGECVSLFNYESNVNLMKCLLILNN